MLTARKSSRGDPRNQSGFAKVLGGINVLPLLLVLNQTEDLPEGVFQAPFGRPRGTWIVHYLHKAPNLTHPATRRKPIVHKLSGRFRYEHFGEFCQTQAAYFSCNRTEAAASRIRSITSRALDTERSSRAPTLLIFSRTDLNSSLG